MAITNFPTPVYYPEITPGISNVGGEFQLRIQTGVPKCMAVLVVPKSGTLDQVEVWIDTVSTAQAIKVSFQDVSLTDGNPDGGVDQFRVVPTGSVVAGWLVPGLITSDGTNTGTKRTVTVGDLLAVVIEFDSTVGDLRFATLIRNSGANLWNGGYSYAGTNNGTTWTKQAGVALQVGLKYSDGTYAYVSPASWPRAAAINTARTFNSGSTPNERGLYFQLPMSVACSGVWFESTRGGDCQVTLYDSDGTTVLASATLDKDVNEAAASLTVTIVPWATGPITLLANTNYRLAVKPTTVTNLDVYDMPVNSNALMAAMPGGANFYLTTRTGAGAWTQTNTLKPLMGLVLAGVDTGGVGGGAGGTVGFASS